jgi:hypothetical protein
MTDINMHLKDSEGKHRIVEGDLDMLADQKGLRAMLKAQKIYVKKRTPILGFIKGGLYKAPATIWDK